MILLDALYINNSGGKVLLDQLVQALYKSGADAYYLLDSRVEGQYDFLPASRVEFMSASLSNRKKFYLQHQTEFAKVLCFGNIPPPVRLKAEVYTYFHQLLYLETPIGTPLLKRLRTALKSWYVKSYKGNSDFWIVQTRYGKSLLSEKFSLNPLSIFEYPFYEEPIVSLSTEKSFQDFVYVSDGNPHKNHDHLLEAWSLVNARQPDWVLHLTISDQYPALANRVEELIQRGLKIQNHRKMSRDQLNQLYAHAGFLVFPSYTESLGLPLIEACHHHCKVIASNLEYCKAVVSATDYFDPSSSEDIARVILDNGVNGHKKPDSTLLVQNQLDALIQKMKD